MRWLAYFPFAVNRVERTTVEQFRAMVTRPRETQSDGRIGYRRTYEGRPSWPRLAKRRAS